MEYSKLRIELAGKMSRPSASTAASRSRAWARLALLLAGCRLDMHVQPKYLPYDPTDFFGDGRSERHPVPGTVARGQLRARRANVHRHAKMAWSRINFRFRSPRRILIAGAKRYNVYCTPCHDYTGTGRGMIVQRGFPQPPSYHIQRLREAPAGHFFEVMTNGFGAMYSYAARVEPADRWRIAAYIRVLQLSRNATIEDVPESDRAEASHAICRKWASRRNNHGAIADELDRTHPAATSIACRQAALWRRRWPDSLSIALGFAMDSNSSIPICSPTSIGWCSAWLSGHPQAASSDGRPLGTSRFAGFSRQTRGRFRLMAVLFVPCFCWHVSNFIPGRNPDDRWQIIAINFRQAYLTAGFFIVRAVFYFAVWILLA